MGASFEERRVKLLRMIALRKAIERAEKAYEALRGDALADALARVDKVEAHAAEIAAERDAARDAAELAEGTIAALRDRLAEMEARLAAARKATNDLPRHLGASWWGQQLRAALVAEPCEGGETHHAGCACHEARRPAEVAALRAEVERLRAEVEELGRSAQMACQSPPDGCDCAGCAFADEMMGGSE